MALMVIILARQLLQTCAGSNTGKCCLQNAYIKHVSPPPARKRSGLASSPGYLPFADDLDDPTEVCTAVLKDQLPLQLHILRENHCCSCCACSGCNSD